MPGGIFVKNGFISILDKGINRRYIIANCNERHIRIMNSKIKRNILLTVIFMAAAACVPGILLAVSWISQSCGFLVYMIMPLYAFLCFLILVWGSCQVVWELPCRKSLRGLYFFLWLVFYPALCLGWLWMNFFVLMAFFRIH